MRTQITVIGKRENLGEGVTWASMSEPTSVDDDFTFSTVMWMLFADALIYGSLALYLDAVFPGEYGVPKPWHFPVTESLSWLGLLASSSAAELAHAVQNDDDDRGRFIEEGPEGFEPGIEIDGLRKVFKTARGTTVAVKGTTLTIFREQITALLGHNGAGKTTTMSMLIGRLQPTSGTAYIGGHSVSTDLSKAQKMVGFCPQHNTLFKSLTVAEH